MEHLEEIRALIARHAGDHQLGDAMPLLRLRHATAASPPSDAMFDRAFVLIAQGQKRAVLDNKVLDYGSGQFLVISVELPVIAQIVRASRAAPYLAFAMTLRPATIAALALELRGDRVDASPVQPSIAVSRTTQALLDPIVRMLRLFGHREDIPVLGPMLEREILWRLLHSDQGAMIRQMGFEDSGLAKISRAISWIRAHFTEKFAIDRPARIAGMSPATFYRNFRAVTAMSPLQYQKRIRLQDARVRLIASDRDIASVGFAVGYDSPSQFSREYARLFGAPPGRDVERLRAARLTENDSPWRMILDGT